MIWRPLRGNLGPRDAAPIEGRDTQRLDLVVLGHGGGAHLERNQTSLSALGKHQIPPIFKPALRKRVGYHI